MQPSSSRRLPADAAPGLDDAVALVHQVLKEVEWVQKISRRLHGRSASTELRERDLECLVELSGSAARSLRRFLDEARGPDPRSGPSLPLDRLVEEARAQVLRRTPGASIRVGIDETVRDRPLPAGLSLALVAVLENAVDFSRPCDPVWVRGRARKGVVEICVEDSGTGMEEHVVAACRDRGFTTRAGRGGRGFGLYAASRILGSSGGELSVESRLGEGTRVVLALPDPGAGAIRSNGSS